MCCHQILKQFYCCVPALGKMGKVSKTKNPVAYVAINAQQAYHLSDRAL